MRGYLLAVVAGLAVVGSGVGAYLVYEDQRKKREKIGKGSGQPKPVTPTPQRPPDPPSQPPKPAPSGKPPAESPKPPEPPPAAPQGPDAYALGGGVMEVSPDCRRILISDGWLEDVLPSLLEQMLSVFPGYKTDAQGGAEAIIFGLPEIGWDGLVAGSTAGEKCADTLAVSAFRQDLMGVIASL